MNQDNVLFDVPRIVDAFKMLNEDAAISLSQAEAVTALDIPNIGNFNPKYTVIAYNILISIKRDPLKDPNKLFILKHLPESSKDYAVYNDRTVFEYLHIMFPELTVDQNDIIAKHLEMVLTYMDTLNVYIDSGIVGEFENDFFEVDEEDLFEFEDDD